MKRLILLEQVRTLFEPLILAVMTSTILAVALVYLQWHAVEHTVLFFWITAALVVAIVRIFVALMFRRENPGPERALHWARLFTASIAAVGAVWACAAIWIMPENLIEHQAVTIIALCGLAGGGVTTLSALRAPMMTFLALLFVPLLTHLLIEFSEFSVTLAMLIALYALFLSGSAERYYINQRQNIVMRLEGTRREHALIESEMKLRLSESRLAETQRIARLGGWEWNAESGELYWSDEVFRIIGEVPQSFEPDFGRFQQYVHPDDRELVRGTLVRVLKEKKTYQIHHRILLPDGSERSVLQEGRVIRSSGDLVLMMSGTIQDVTEQTMLEEQFRQSQKMEAVGTLVGGIAHDFNNVLGAIQNNLFIAERKLEHQATLRSKLENIRRLSERASEMVRQLLAFARKERVTMKAIVLNDFMHETFRLTRNAVPENIGYQCNNCDEKLTVRGDVTQLHQVLMNLLNNAIYAVSDCHDPSIRCSLERFLPDERFRQLYPGLTEEAFARITVSDNGTGIEPESMEKIFEPFYTTKRVGEGSGLGLSMVYGTIHAHGGVIEVESEPEKGSVFHLYLPLIGSDNDGENGQSETLVYGEGETIILADDEADMRDSVGEVLESLGYEVLLAVDGIEAIEQFEKNRDRVSLMILDIIMPRMGGTDAAKKIRQIDPDIPLIFATGYDRRSRGSHKELKRSCIISKPFSVEEISQAIRELLAKS